MTRSMSLQGGVRKYVELRRLLDQCIDERNAGDALPSYTQLRVDYGISRSTADRIFQELVAEGRIVRIQGKGIYVSERAKQKTVALVFGKPVYDVMSAPYPKLLLGCCQAYALQRNQRLLTFYGAPKSDAEAEDDPSFHDLVTAIKTKNVDGIIFGGYMQDPGQVPWLVSQGLPVVTPDFSQKFIDRSGFAMVTYDAQALVHLAVDALVKQNCRNIALISHCEAGDVPDKELWPAAVHFRDALERHGLVVYPDWIWDARENMPPSRSMDAFAHEIEGFQAFSDLLRTVNSKGDRPQGIVVTDDFMTRGCIFAAAKLGVRIGKDIKIASHANQGSSILRRFENDFALIEVDVRGMADAMVWTLDLMMQGKPYEELTRLMPRLKLPVTEIP